MSITMWSIISFILLGICFIAWRLAFTAWLCQASRKAEMNRALWTVLGLIFGLAAVVVFLIVRALTHRRCPACGKYQKSSTYCRYCGADMHQATKETTNKEQTPKMSACPNCGRPLSGDESYCPNCGAFLKDAASIKAAESSSKKDSTDVGTDAVSGSSTDENPAHPDSSAQEGEDGGLAQDQASEDANDGSKTD